jgi:hypothetical protein
LIRDDWYRVLAANLFGTSCVFRVEAKKAENPAAADAKDTANLAWQ